MVILWMNDSWCHKRKSNYWLSIKEIRQPPCTRVAEISITILRENILSLKSQLIKYCMESGKRQKGSFWCSKFWQLRGDGSRLGFPISQSWDLHYIYHTRARDWVGEFFFESIAEIYTSVVNQNSFFSSQTRIETSSPPLSLVISILYYTNS